ncbi:alpha/beta-hydrolase [Aaosphaeria arxii CBS 175.79]|uniref:Alpha/beta-hydrolase n=1 Tax=Aaosphaeria arxii CBS 175.79 TaxID=1450172 RepID=A0A6A5XRK8_9PLEO|nr:alpha/beta-hydrolase [Aaosphaeria arxii CBS 175.79]KAF2015539.1 alpha/beta-hydrolase [Aaosphaeria arxii CBS 175.79]
MTNLFLGHGQGNGHGHERRRRKHSSSHKSSQSQAIPQSNTYATTSTVYLQQHAASPSAPAVQAPNHSQSHIHPAFRVPRGSAPTAPHPVYGPVPQCAPPTSLPYGSPPSHPATHAQVNPSTISFAASPPQGQKERRGPFDSYFNRVDRLASKSYADLKNSTGKSTTNLVSKTSQYFDNSTQAVAKKSTQALNHGAALCDIISSKLDAVITSIDGDLFSGKEQDLFIQDTGTPPQPSRSHPSSSSNQNSSSKFHRSEGSSRGNLPDALYGSNDASTKGLNHFSKVWLYKNSRLPPHLPPFKVYMPTYPLLCLAATYSERVYTPPAPKTSEKEAHIPSDWRSGTKAMVLKSVPIDDMHTIVFAIRGSATFMDWAVNYRSDPSAPTNFLDDPGNLCHAGFLYVARKMVAPVAERLRSLLQENPSRSHCSLLITGHSAGGAVAALLYAHMMSTTIDSELSHLTGFFKRVHCVTFGAPPVTLLPLAKPADKRHRKSLFYNFINEGDPVPRADKLIVRSLLKLYASPAPSTSSSSSLLPSSLSKLNLSSTSSAPAAAAAVMAAAQPTWPIPATTLSPAGRLIVLRKRPGGKDEDDVEAVTVDDDMLRKVVYGDPVKHMMGVYRRRVECLAVRAVTAGGY